MEEKKAIAEDIRRDVDILNEKITAAEKLGLTINIFDTTSRMESNSKKLEIVIIEAIVY